MGKSLWLISWCTLTPPFVASSVCNGNTNNSNLEPVSSVNSNLEPVSSSVRVLAYSTIIERVLSKVRGYHIPDI